MALTSTEYRCLWDDEPSHPGEWPSSQIESDVHHDVVIVGGGLTGLWTALYLAESSPDLSILIVEREKLGYGASGRNGGWCSALLPMGLGAIERVSSRSKAIAMQTALRDTVPFIGRECERLGIDCDFALGGTIEISRSRPQLTRAEARLAEFRAYGLDEGLSLLSSDEVGAIVGATRVTGGLVDRHCAALHPGRLVRGLARAVRRSGVQVIEGVGVTRVEPHRVHHERGIAHAKHIVVATEGYSASLAGRSRNLLPIHSMMIATEPLDQEILDAIGLADRTTFNDGRHMIIYGQRTADGRIAFGGRGAPYHWGSRVGDRYSTDPVTARSLVETLMDLFPILRNVEFTHHWGGPLGAARDWWSFVQYDEHTGIGTAGGYVGDGVAATNLAGRTLARLVAGIDDELTRLPWVGHRSRAWEPEPLRWLGVNSLTRLARFADSHEERTGRSSNIASGLIDRLTGG